MLHVLLALAVIALVSCYLSTLWGAPWAPTSLSTVDRMLKLAGAGPGKRVVDLGAGDGRIVIRAARRFGAQATGIEIDPLRCAFANAAIWLRGICSQARVVHGNFFYHDLSQADVVTLYVEKAREPHCLRWGFFTCCKVPTSSSARIWRARCAPVRASCRTAFRSMAGRRLSLTRHGICLCTRSAAWGQRCRNGLCRRDRFGKTE